MREIHIDTIVRTVERLCIEANYNLGEDVEKLLREGMAEEKSDFGKYIFEQILKNVDLARRESVAMCQDTGLAVVYLEVGQDVHITGGSLNEAVNEGVRRGYINGYLRKSAVDDPLFQRVNTKDNTPAIIYTDIVPGDKIKIMVVPKGGGAENMGGIKMLKPSDGVQGVIDFVVKTVTEAGGNPCPPVIVGVGIGGTMEKATMLAKKALTREAGKHNDNPDYAQLEKVILEKINNSGVGPQGLGGRITALAVHIEYFPTHIATMPVAVNLNCHASRHAEAVIEGRG